MENVTESLKKLYVAFGGNADDIVTLTNITDVSNAIATLLGGEGDGASIVEAIENIVPVVPTGGTLDSLISREIVRITNNSITNIGQHTFSSCIHLEFADFANVTNIDAYAFLACSNLRTLVLRKNLVVQIVTTPSTLASFNDTPIANGTGYVYVPDNLVNTYKAHDRWSTYAAQIKPISELEEE